MRRLLLPEHLQAFLKALRLRIYLNMPICRHICAGHCAGRDARMENENISSIGKVPRIGHREERQEHSAGVGEGLIIAEKKPSRVRCCEQVKRTRYRDFLPGISAVRRCDLPVVGQQNSRVRSVLAKVVVRHRDFSVAGHC